ncbi:transporter [Geomonas sp. RF6]|uniref:aspartate:alanine exchanger family transporter n=1 Tax=Geomonas sp. RF6 TaxID=2897342 RepID=UPI001E307563|nr:aspartate:alanine exchanger family transporter [Geomonas sp. RF6]UFS71488.1 transporter [Geomonas sp. RF6]
MIKILLDNPLLLLFLVAGIGFPLGRIKIFGSSFGVAAVLFVGLAFGSLHPQMKLPDIVYMLGLSIFIYSIGLSGGRIFVASFKKQGLKYNLMVLLILTICAALTALAGKIFNLKGTITAGLYSGSLTSTPSLAAILDTLKHNYSGPWLEQLLAEPVVGYSITYPMGVIGTVLAITVAQRIWRIDFHAEARGLSGLGAATEPLKNCTIRVLKPEVSAKTLYEARHEEEWDVIFGRLKRGDHYALAAPEARLQLGDLITVVGSAAEIERVADYLGERSDEEIDLDRSEFDYRRIFVSNHDIAGRRLRDLKLRQRFGAVVTRVRRGDDEFLPNADLVLELGDRVRVLTHHDNIKEVTKLFGDSYRAVSEVDVLTFGLGLALGLLLGIVPIPLPGEITFKFGFAGGPLVAGLVLGTLGHTGKMFWNLPYSANMTLRQIGMVLFLAGVGTRAGYSFLSTFTKGGGFLIFGIGIAITCTASLLALWIGYRLLKIPMSLLMGIIAGMQTQTAVLGYALEQTRNDLPNIGFASVYPAATILKIICVQILLVMLQ